MKQAEHTILQIGLKLLYFKVSIDEISVPDTDRIRIKLGQRIRIKAGQNFPQKVLNPDPDSAIGWIQIQIQHNNFIRIRIKQIRIRTLVQMSVPYLLNQGNKALKKYVIMLTKCVSEVYHTGHSTPNRFF